MKTTEYAWLDVEMGMIHSVRPHNGSGLTEIKRGDSFESSWHNLRVSGWRLSPGQTLPLQDEFEIQIERDSEYIPPRKRGASVRVDGNGTFAENVREIQRRFEVNGWDLCEVISTTNAGPMMLFSKPGGTPDRQPFVEPSLQD